MENLSACFRISSLFCCIVCISSTEERRSVSEVVGNPVKLQCNNSFPYKVKQVTWTRNGTALLSFEPQSPIYQHPDALRLEINMSVSKNDQYALIIQKVQKEHEGNYTCEIMPLVLQAKWELIITEEKPGKLDMRVMIPVICTCSLVFIMILTLFIRKVCKKSPPNNIPEEQTEDIYENCLEINATLRWNTIR